MPPDSTFDVDSFLSTTYTDANSTSRIPVPIGEYQAQVKRINPKKVTFKSGDEGYLFELNWHILGDEAAKATNLDEPIVRQSIFVDVTEGGALDMRPGLNVDLGRLRDAVGQNIKGSPWNPAMLLHSTAWVKVEHETDQNGEPRAIIKRVSKTKSENAPADTAQPAQQRKRG
jgi:hypothetical protein